MAENLVVRTRMFARGSGVSIRLTKTKSQLACRPRPTHSAAGSHQVAHKFRERASPIVYLQDPAIKFIYTFLVSPGGHHQLMLDVTPRAGTYLLARA